MYLLFLCGEPVYRNIVLPVFFPGLNCYFYPSMNSSSSGIDSPQHSGSFSRFVFKTSLNKKYLLWALAGIVLQLVVFKLCYPFADYITDSYTYIDAATSHSLVSYRPMGYSRLLQGLHRLTTSDTVLVCLQFLVLQCGGLFLFFTVRYLFNLNKTISTVLFLLLLFNPVVLYLSNYVSSDALYIGVSLCWFAELLWIINRPNWYQVIEQAILLFIIFKLRYAALYLPVISILAFVMSRHKWWYQLSGIVLTVLPLFIEVKRIQHITKKETGTAIFSAFSGWMAANNALHMYPYITVKNEDFTSPECVELNTMVKNYFDTVPAPLLPYPNAKVDYLWGDNAPLKKFMYHKKAQKHMAYFNAWHAAAPVFAEYSRTLVRQHPVAFARYFMWPNAKLYIVPPIESLLAYNAGLDTVDETAADWFKYKSTRVTSVKKDGQRFLLYPVVYFFTVLNVVFCVAFGLFLFKRKQQPLTTPLFLSILLAGFFWVIYFLFSTYAAPIVLRFQVFPMIVYITFSCVLLNRLLPPPKHT